MESKDFSLVLIGSIFMTTIMESTSPYILCAFSIKYNRRPASGEQLQHGVTSHYAMFNLANITRVNQASRPINEN
jgi:hypothetical protein